MLLQFSCSLRQTKLYNLILGFELNAHFAKIVADLAGIASPSENQKQQYSEALSLAALFKFYYTFNTLYFITLM